MSLEALSLRSAENIQKQATFLPKGKPAIFKIACPGGYLGIELDMLSVEMRFDWSELQESRKVLAHKVEDILTEYVHDKGNTDTIQKKEGKTDERL